MIFAAILKHVSIRNSDYGAAQRYLLFEHDGITQKPLFDENHNMILRQGLILTGLCCDPFTFNTECTELNRRFHKNLTKGEVKAHQYILSFDPKDISERGLTPQKAHAIAEAFAQRFFAGHQVLLATHPDGHNHSGNLHTHIVLNSLRKENVPWQAFMERPTDAQAGYKHHQTRLLLRNMQEALNELCVQQHLHTMEFGLPPARKVSDREYRARQTGQTRLDALNQQIVSDGLKPSSTTFRTVKEQLRQAIDAAIQEADSAGGFIHLLQERNHITVRTSRGHWSFLHPEYKRPIRGRTLGSLYEQEALSARLQMKDPVAHRPEYAALPPIFFAHSDLRLVTDIQACVKAQQSRAYARKVNLSNLQRMAQSIVFLQRHGIGTLDALETACAEAEQQYLSASSALHETQHKLTGLNEQIHYLGQYLAKRTIYNAFLSANNKAEFRTLHAQEIQQYECARSYLQKTFDHREFPSLNDLRTERDRLRQARLQQKSAHSSAAQQRKTLQIVRNNVQTLLRPSGDREPSVR